VTFEINNPRVDEASYITAAEIVVDGGEHSDPESAR